MVFLGTWFNVLLIFVVLAILAEVLGAGPVPVFTLSCIALIPLAERLSFSTEQCALYTTPTIGGLLNATFGNISELVFVILAIAQGSTRLAQLFLLGSILGNLLLVLGCSFLVGGLRHREQKYPKQGTIANMGILLLGTLALIVPSVLNSSNTEASVISPFQSVLQVSRVTSIFMMVLYVAYLVFQLGTHVHLFEDVDEIDEGDHEEPQMGLWGSIFWLGFFAAFITIMSDYVVETITVVAETQGGLLPIGFLTVVVLPVVGNVAEHSSAIIFAWKNEMPITLGICVGSATQIMVFMVPFAVLFGWAYGIAIALDFEVFETTILFATIVSVALVIQDGRSNWFKGLVLVIVYCVVSAGFWFHSVDIAPYVVSNTENGVQMQMLN